VASKSFASLRLRPIQAKKRSTTHRRGKTVKQLGKGSVFTVRLPGGAPS
jgi:hypothetical protein